MDNEIYDRLDFIEFRQDLLFENTDFSKFLYESKVTKQQLKGIHDLFNSLRTKINDGEKTSDSNYESGIYEIVPHKFEDYHFAELIAKSFHEEGKYGKVFENLYGDSMKFQSYFDSKK